MIIGYIGKPGAGKTTALTSIVQKNELKKKICCYVPFLDCILKPYTVIYCNDKSIYNCIYYESSTLGDWKPVPNSLILISEAGVYFNNRNTFKCNAAAHRLFAIHRHLHTDIVWESQTVDVDIKLRQRTDSIWLLTKSLLPNRSILQKVFFKIDVNDEQHTLSEIYSVPRGLLGKLFCKLTFMRKTLNRKKYYKFFNSWNEDDFVYTLKTPLPVAEDNEALTA